MAAYAEGFNILHHADVGTAPAHGRRRDDAAAQSRALPVRAQPARRRRGLAARQRGGLLAAGSRRHRAARAAGSQDLLGPGLGLRRGPLDHHGRHRGGRACAGAEQRALRTLHLARRGRFRQQGALGHALRVRRPHRASRRGASAHARPAIGRARLLRRHGRPRPQEDLPGPHVHDQAGSPGRAGDRGGEGGLEPGPAPRPGPRQPRALRRRRRRGAVRQAARAPPLRGRRLPRPRDLPGPPQGARRAPPGPCTIWRFRRACSASSSRRSGHRAAPRTRASSSRSPSATTRPRRAR